MSTLMDGISNMNTITAQIAALKSADKANLPSADATLLALKQNFNQMLLSLVSSGNDDDDDRNTASCFDPYYFLNQSNLISSSNPLSLALSGSSASGSSTGTTSSSLFGSIFSNSNNSGSSLDPSYLIQQSLLNLQNTLI